MHLAVTLPGDDFDFGQGRSVAGQVLVRQHDDARHPERLDDLLRVARGAADVGLGLHRRRGIDVGDDRHARMALPQQLDIGCRDRCGERASGFEVGDQHGFCRVQQLGGLGHEVDAGEHDHIGIGARRLARQRQAVTNDIADRVENVWGLIVVRQDDRVAFLFELEDRRDVGGEDRPFERRNVPLDALIELRKRRGNPGGGVGGLQHRHLL